MRKKIILFIILFIFCVPEVQCAIHTETVEYRHNDILLEGYLAYDDAIRGKRPAILVVHEWTGIGNYIRMRVEQLAEQGYIAFAADIYGKGIRPKNREEAAK